MMRKFKTNRLEDGSGGGGGVGTTISSDTDLDQSRIDFTLPFIAPKTVAIASTNANTNITNKTANKTMGKIITTNTTATAKTAETTREKISPFDDASAFLGFAARALARDEFTQCFEPKPIRSPKEYYPYLTYLFGLFIRYFILFPLRLSFFLVANWLFISLFPFLFITKSQRFMMFLYGWYCRAWLVAFGARIRYHGRKPNLTRTPHIFVSNHTSFIDFFLLSSIGKCHATVAQVHGGLFGFLQRHILSLNGSLTFQRSELKDRLMVTKRMKEHVHRMNTNEAQAPLLIFPEGTCVNNEATVLFHKGAFELGAIVCPAAIKYRKELSDPYWNTREQTFSQHLLYLMTRWHLDADVHWLEPQKAHQGEDGIHFANRIKESISLKCGIKNLSWNGYMKNYMKPVDRERLLKGSQEAYGFTVKERLSSPPPSQPPTQPPQQQTQSQGVCNGSPGDSDSGDSSECGVNFSDKDRKTTQTTQAASEQKPFLPEYLSEGAITNIKNELIKRTAAAAAAAVDVSPLPEEHNEEDVSSTAASAATARNRRRFFVNNSSSNNENNSCVTPIPDDLLSKIITKNEDILQTWRKAAHHSQDGRRVIHCEDTYNVELASFVNRSSESLTSFVHQSPPLVDLSIDGGDVDLEVESFPTPTPASATPTGTPAKASSNINEISNRRIENNAWRQWFKEYKKYKK